MRDIKKYTDDYVVHDFETYQVEYRRKKVIEQINLYHPKRILEIGCGEVPLFGYLAGGVCWTICEPSEVFCKNAENNVKESQCVKIIQGFFEDKLSELEKEKYDMIICSSLLHEVENPHKILDGIYGLCKDNTIVHINVPNAKSFHRILARNMDISNEYEKSERNIRLQQNNVYDLDMLSGIIISHGFKILDNGSYFIKPFTHKQMFEMLEQGVIDKKVLDGLYNMTNDMPAWGSEIFVNCKK